MGRYALLGRYWCRGPVCCLIWALGRIPSSTVGITLTLSPISAFIFAWPVLGEAVTYQALIGLVLVVSAILIMNRQPE